MKKAIAWGSLFIVIAKFAPTGEGMGWRVVLFVALLWAHSMASYSQGMADGKEIYQKPEGGD